MNWDVNAKYKEGIGTCNFTSHGEDFKDGYYGSTALRPLNYLISKDKPIYCKYTFIGVVGQRILFTVKSIDIGSYDHSEERCKEGYLKIWDGLKKPGHHPFPPNTLCGKYKPEEINIKKLTTRKTGEVVFYSDSRRRGDIFLLTYKYINLELEKAAFPKQIEHNMVLGKSVCDWEILIESCSQGYCDIVSPGYPGIYPPDIQCRYHIYTNNNTSTLQLIFHEQCHKQCEMDIRKTNNCIHDSLLIYDGSNTQAPLIGKFCGHEMSDITATGQHLYLEFNSGPDVPPYGFIGFHTTAIGVTKEWHQGATKIKNTLCDWRIIEKEGSISSPDHWLPAETSCSYYFNLQTESHVEIILTVYGMLENCHEKIDIYRDNELLDQICAKRLKTAQPRFVYNMSGNDIIVKYYTDQGQYHSNSNAGFWMSFRLMKGRKKYSVSESIMLRDESTLKTRVFASQTSSIHQSSLSLNCLKLSIFIFSYYHHFQIYIPKVS